MATMYQHLTEDYVRNITNKWGKLLDAGTPVKGDSVRAATAVMLENTQREFGLLTEAGSAPTGALGSQGSSVFGTTTDYSVTDSRIPTIVMPLLRRTFPDYLAHKLVGVQPMNGPLSFAYALRFKYGANGMGVAGGSLQEGTEIGYNTVDSRFTGTSGLAGLSTAGDYAVSVPGTAALSPADVGGAATTNAMWAAFAGVTTDGQANTLANSEWQAIGDDMPMAKLAIEKGIVQAKTRTLAAHWSLALAEDMKAMNGLDIDSEMSKVLGYEIKNEEDRQLLGEMVKAAISASQTSTWSPVSADGRNQNERIGTLYTQILLKSNRIGVLTRRGPANWLVASPTACALMERLALFNNDKAGGGIDTFDNVGGVTEVGTFKAGALKAYRDTLAAGDYILLGYKGNETWDTGIVYCPYIPVQLHKAIGPDNFSPRIGVRSRYGILANLFGSGYYYQFIKLDGIQNAALAADGGRVFIQ